MTTEATRGHTFDGIEEFDNRLPNWWLWTFYGACIFSVFYWIHYHTLGTGNLPSEEYAIAQREAAARMEAKIAANPITDESLRQMASEPAVVEAGRALYLEPTNALRCAFCHRDDGGGLVGPNLTDDMWVYGGKPMDIYTSILKGRPGGMPAHEGRGIGFATKVTAFVMSIQNTNVPGKAPEPNAKKEQ